MWYSQVFLDMISFMYGLFMSTTYTFSNTLSTDTLKYYCTISHNLYLKVFT